MATRYLDRDEPCTHCGGPVQTIIVDAPNMGSRHVPQVYGQRHAEFPDMGGVDDVCTREPRG